MLDTGDPQEFYREIGRLLHWALQPQKRPLNEPEYAELVRRYENQRDFRDAACAIAAGLGLRVLGVGQLGVVLVPEVGSVFEIKSSERNARSGGADERLLDGLIQIAILATIYPRAQDLEEDPRVARQPISVEDVEGTLHQLCQRQADATRGQPDLPVETYVLGMQEAWRVYWQRQAPGELAGMIRRNFELLRVQGCLVKVRGKECFQPTWNYQHMAKEFTAPHIHQVLQQMLGRNW